MNKKKKYKGLSRIDNDSARGWFVRGYKNGKTYSKFFSDGKYGGKRKGLVVAMGYRDELYKELESVSKEPRARRVVLRDIRNVSGVLGVCRICRRGSSGKVYQSYSVSWRPEPGVQRCTSFSIGKYGEAEAFRLAVEFRRERMEEVFIREREKGLDRVR